MGTIPYASREAMTELACKMWGEPNPTLSTKNELRYGTRGSKSVDLAKLVFNDHETDQGGGYRDLYRLVHGHYPTNGVTREDHTNGKLGPAVGCWFYHNEHGEVISRVRRFNLPDGSRTFPQSTPDGHGGWTKGLGGIGLPLYHLPDLLAAPADTTVYIVEGEKHADALRAWRLLATTNPGGAGKFKPRHAQVIAGRNCIILPDNDETGQQHARKVIAELKLVGARTCIINLPGLPEKGDIIDWIATGGTAEQLAELVRQSEQPEPKANGAAPAPVVHLDAWDGLSPTEIALRKLTAKLSIASTDRQRAKLEIDIEAARARVAAEQVKSRAKKEAEAAKVREKAEARAAKDAADQAEEAAAKARAKARTTDTPEILAVVERFNAKYMVVNEAGKAIIYTQIDDEILHRKYYNRLTFRDLEQLYLNEPVQVGLNDHGQPITKNVANVWLHHPNRSQCIGGAVFDPTSLEPKPGILNLWKGFNVIPTPGDWSLMKSHTRSIICDSHDELFTYLMGWMAYMIQHPNRQGEVAVVMRGREGAGKGTLVKALLRIFGQHGIAINNAKHLVGNFNDHLRDVVLLFADEAFYAGDRQHVGALKAIITEPHLTIEAKFCKAVQMPNFVHLMMASNEEWVVPASLSARRFLMLDVPDTVMRNLSYFTAIQQQMDDGGYEAMLYDLLHYDLTGFNVRNVPDTAGLQTQKKLSLPTTEAWWMDCLQRGYVYKSKLGLGEFFEKWHDTVAKELLFDSYLDYAKQRNERRSINRETLGIFMHKMDAKPARPRRSVVGEHLTDVTTKDGFGNVTGSKRIAEPRVQNDPRPRAFTLGTLDQARDAFVQETSLAVTWDDTTADDETDD